MTNTNRPTEKQLTYARSLIGKLDYAESVRLTKQLRKMTSSQVSDLIDTLKAA